MTDVVMILDASSSMRDKYEETTVAFDEYVRGVRNDGSVENMYVVAFSSRIGTVRIHDGVSVHDIPPLAKDQYRPIGSTPLYDAIGDTLNNMGNDPKFVVIITDGEENDSARFTQEQVRDMIAHREAQGWDFIYLGADIDAWGANRGIGASRGKTVSFSGAQFSQGMEAARRATRDYNETGERLPDDYFTPTDDYHEGYFDPDNN